MVDFWNSWRGEYNDAALKTKCALTTTQYKNKQTNDLTSVPCLWYPIICADSNRWKSSHHSPHGLLISKLEHHRRCQKSEGKKNSRFRIEVH